MELFGVKIPPFSISESESTRTSLSGLPSLPSTVRRRWQKWWSSTITRLLKNVGANAAEPLPSALNAAMSASSRARTWSTYSGLYVLTPSISPAFLGSWDDLKTNGGRLDRHPATDEELASLEV